MIAAIESSPSQLADADACFEVPAHHPNDLRASDLRPNGCGGKDPAERPPAEPKNQEPIEILADLINRGHAANGPATNPETNEYEDKPVTPHWNADLIDAVDTLLEKTARLRLDITGAHG